jgi:signal transduction histidine kinase
VDIGLAAASGGTLAITSPLGGGTTIVVELPIEHDRSPDRPEAGVAA